jgi:hypothetical protein
VLADLGRSLDTGISSDSLGAAIGQARAQIKTAIANMLAAVGRERANPKSKGATNRSRWPSALFQLSKLTLRACLGEIRTSHHPRPKLPVARRGPPDAQPLVVAEKDLNGRITTKEFMPVRFSLLEGAEELSSASLKQ